MCGIAGSLSAQADEHQRQVEEMLERFRYRGPDQLGCRHQPGVALGACRLAIRDLSPLGHQPMVHPETQQWTVFNGEIYNYQELRAELESLGQVFHSRCDTEVLMRGFAVWDKALFPRLRGMFALAFWDPSRRRLVLGRDPLGIKPLYYQVEPGPDWKFRFASELKSLPAKRGVSEELVYDFLVYGLLDHTSQTLFEGCFSLPAGTSLEVDADGKLQSERYWDFSVCDQWQSASTTSADELRSELEEIVALHLQSDQQVGCCLSGGLDSSLLTAFVARQLPGLKTFSLGNTDAKSDELGYARQVNQFCGAAGQVAIPQARQFLEELPNLLWHQDLPIAGPGVYAQWCLMKLIQQTGLRVVLDGQGADELFLGYRKFYYFLFKTLWKRRQWRGIAQEISGLARHLQLWSGLDPRWGLRYIEGLAGLGVESLLLPGFRAAFSNRNHDGLSGGTFAERIKADLTQYSLPVLLRYEDRNSMAFSIESRVPYVDHRLVERICALPLQDKLRGGQTKSILRQAARGLLPEGVRSRASKLGFHVPWQDWLAEGLQSEVERTLQEAQFLPQFVDVPRLLAACRQPGWRQLFLTSQTIFRFYILEKWHQVFFAGPRGSAARP